MPKSPYEQLMDRREELVKELLGTYQPGEWWQAVLLVAEQAGVAVAYEDRETIESRIGRKLTEPEWTRVVDELDGFDEWLSNSGGAESVAYWVTDVLMPKAGVTVE